MIFVALSEAAQKGKLLLVDGGMLRFHLRRDGPDCDYTQDPGPGS